jgi:hypothetical protein
MPLTQALADALSTTFTDERYPVGTTFMETSPEVTANLSGVSDLYTDANWLGKGERTWIFIQAGTGGIDAGETIKREAAVATTDPFVGIASTVADSAPRILLGVADHDIAASSYGWIIKNGACVFDGTGSAIAAGNFVSCGGAAGVVVEDTDEESPVIIGMATESLSAVLTNFAQGYVFL